MRRLGVPLFLLACILAGALWLGTRDLDERLSTQVTALLPANERDPAVRLVRSLATTDHAHTMLVVIGGVTNAQQRGEAVRIVADVLKASPLIAEVWPIDGPPVPDSTLAHWSEHAVEWFWPQWWADNGKPEDPDVIADSMVAALSAFLERPESSFWEDYVTADPFLLVPSSMGTLGSAIQQGNQARSEPDANGRIWLQLAVSPLSPEGRQPVFALLQNAEASLQASLPSAWLLDTGVNRFADASELAIRGEVSRLNLLVAITVGALCLIFLRQWTVLGPLMLIAGITMVSGAVFALLLFPSVHIFTLVIGSILIGVAVDYGLHVFLAAEATSGRERVRAIARPLLVGSLSTIGGFLILTLTELPMLREMGVFIAGGLLAALAASLLYARHAHLASQPVRWLDRIESGRSTKPFVATFLLLSPLLAGVFFIEWSDDIRELNYPLPEVQANDDLVREQFGPDSKQAFLLVGEDWKRVIASAARLSLPPDAVSLSDWVTPPDLARAAHEAAGQLPLQDAAIRALEADGYAAEAFAPFFEQWLGWTAEPWSPERYEASVSAQLASLPGPAALLAGSDDSSRWWLIRSPSEIEAPPGVTLVPLAQLDSLNSVFARYRVEAMRAAAIGLSVLALGLLLGFGLKTGIAVLVLPVVPALLVTGFWGWTGYQLNLFHLLGGFLAVCLTVDYIVFALQSRRKHLPLPVSITLSALTTSASFAWLATSAIPAVAALGSVVAPTVLLAWGLALGLTAQSSAPEMSDLP